MEGILLDGADQALGDQRDAPRSTLIHAGISVPHTAGYASAHLGQVSQAPRSRLLGEYSEAVGESVSYLFVSARAALRGRAAPGSAACRHLRSRKSTRARSCHGSGGPELNNDGTDCVHTLLPPSVPHHHHAPYHVQRNRPPTRLYRRRRCQGRSGPRTAQSYKENVFLFVPNLIGAPPVHVSRPCIVC